MNSVIPPRRSTIISDPPSAQGCTEGVTPRIGQYGSSQLGFVAHLVALRIAEGSDQRVFGPIFIDGLGVVDGHDFPCFTAIIGGEPLLGTSELIAMKPVNTGFIPIQLLIVLLNVLLRFEAINFKKTKIKNKTFRGGLSTYLLFYHDCIVIY